MLHRFSRTEMLIGPEGLETLRQASVAVFGVGGVGSFAVEALARAGIGRLTLIDHDVVSLTNLNRQLPALESTLGRPKAAVLQERIQDINPHCRVELIQEAYGPEKETWLQPGRWHFIVDAIDSMAAKVDLIRTAVHRGIPIVASMGAGNKLDPGAFRIADISKTHTCPMARSVRRLLKNEGITKDLPVVFSLEKPLVPLAVQPEEAGLRSQVPGSISFVPSAAGLLLAGYVVRTLLDRR